MAEYCYLEDIDVSYYKIKCEMCNKDTQISEEQMQQCNDNGGEEVCYRCMWGED